MIGLAPRRGIPRPRKGWLRAYPAVLRGDELRATGGVWERRVSEEEKRFDKTKRLFANIGGKFVVQNQNSETAVEIIAIAKPGFLETWRVRFLGERIADGSVHVWRLS